MAEADTDTLEISAATVSQVIAVYLDALAAEGIRAYEIVGRQLARRING